ncbi:MAG: right-handed parallel beta-helix repeat-containing protein [Candidatus Thermoplasmatota archaeon]|nr:right-handed parallel beta-helix repeat-containing protein [Candidatus Thermoplasmatota archaeon]
MYGSQNVLTKNQIAHCNTIGLYLFDASWTSIQSNNCIDNQKDAGFEIFSRMKNHFLNNYWDTSVKFGLKVIYGTRYIQIKYFLDYQGNPIYLPLAWTQFDWNPAQEPYSIPDIKYNKQ